MSRQIRIAILVSHPSVNKPIVVTTKSHKGVEERIRQIKKDILIVQGLTVGRYFKRFDVFKKCQIDEIKFNPVEY